MLNVFNGIMVQMRHYSFDGGAGKPSRVEVVPITADEEDLSTVLGVCRTMYPTN